MLEPGSSIGWGLAVAILWGFFSRVVLAGVALVCLGVYLLVAYDIARAWDSLDGWERAELVIFWVIAFTLTALVLMLCVWSLERVYVPRLRHLVRVKRNVVVFWVVDVVMWLFSR